MPSLLNPASPLALGRIPDEPIGAYHGTLALSASKLKDFAPPEGRPSFFYKKYILQVPMEEKRTDALDTGNQADVLILEGDDAYNEHYAVFDIPAFGDQRKADNKRAKDAWEAENKAILESINSGEKERVSLKDHALNLKLREAVYENPLAAAILRCCQPQITWRVKMPEFYAQCRTDLFTDCVSEEVVEMVKDFIPGLRPGDMFFADLKTTASLDAGDFTNIHKQIEASRYYRQLAFYRVLIQRVTGRPLAPGVIIGVEKNEPLECGVYYIDEDALMLGEDEIGIHLRNLELCCQTNIWPGVPQGQLIPHVMRSFHASKVQAEIEEANNLFRYLQSEKTRLEEVADD